MIQWTIRSTQSLYFNTFYDNNTRLTRSKKFSKVVTHYYNFAFVRTLLWGLPIFMAHFRLTKVTTMNPLTLSQRRMPNKEILSDLSRFQRILLVTDGTITEILEQYLAEKIKVHKIYEKIEHDPQHIFPHHQTCLDYHTHPTMKREVLLQGQQSGISWVHAESTVILDHLVQGFRTDLLNSREPIGCLWEKYQIETFKQIVDFAHHPAGKLAKHLNLHPNDHVISRTYTVHSAQKLIMIITENFPANYFKH